MGGRKGWKGTRAAEREVGSRGGAQRTREAAGEKDWGRMGAGSCPSGLQDFSLLGACLRILNNLCLDPLPPSDVDASLWKGWMEAVKPLGGAEFCFRTVKRSDVWTATYTSAQSLGAVLELVLDSLEPRWQVSVEPPRERGPLRDALSRPVLRVSLDHDGSLLSGTTEVFVPDQQSFDVKVTGKTRCCCASLACNPIKSAAETFGFMGRRSTGNSVSSFAPEQARGSWWRPGQASLGLKKEFEGAKRWSQWQVEVPKKV